MNLARRSADFMLSGKTYLGSHEDRRGDAGILRFRLRMNLCQWRLADHAIATDRWS